MIKINLKAETKGKGQAKKLNIDPRVLKILNIEKVSWDLSVIIILVAALFIGLFPHLFFVKYQTHVQEKHKADMAELSTTEASLKSEIENYKTIQAEMHSIEESEQKLKNRLSVVRNLQSSRKGVVTFLDALGQLLPERCWLTKLDFQLSPQANIQIAGKSYSNSDVSEYVSKLGASVLFEKVNLDSLATQRATEKDASVKEFFIYLIPKT